jgi:hypothetical protein
MKDSKQISKETVDKIVLNVLEWWIGHYRDELEPGTIGERRLHLMI